jgi:hypothetical protein
MPLVLAEEFECVGKARRRLTLVAHRERQVSQIVNQILLLAQLELEEKLDALFVQRTRLVYAERRPRGR